MSTSRPQLHRHLQAALLFTLGTILGIPVSSAAAPPDSRPVEGIRSNPPDVFALVGGKIVQAPGQVIEQGTLIIRDGLIARVDANLPVPAEAIQVDVTGKTIFPGLVDAYNELNIANSPSRVGHWNPSITPQALAADAYRIDEAKNSALRSQGVVARLVAPRGGIIKGQSAVVTTGEGRADLAVIETSAALHCRLTIPYGRSREQYPNSPMGAVALARQTMLDAHWHADAWRAHRADPAAPPPGNECGPSGARAVSQ